MNTTKVRTIHTGLYGAAANEVIDSVHGQLSDGKWENSPGADKYWTNFYAKAADDGEVILNVNAESCTICCGRWLNNPFFNMSDEEFKKWVAQKIKAVVNDERRDCSDSFGAWDRMNTSHTSCYLGHSDEKYGPVVTVADIYCTYEALLGRRDLKHKYDETTISRVFGTKRTDEEAAKVKSIRESIESLKAELAQKRKELQKARDEAVAKLDKELSDKVAALNIEMNERIKKAQAGITA